jgi:hypothetical protein
VGWIVWRGGSIFPAMLMHAVDRHFTFVRGLSLFTLLSSALVAYFQYLSAYQDKVSIQARDDLKSVADTFTEVSVPFSNVLALQHMLYSDFAKAVRSKSDANTQALGSKNALEMSKAYEKARTELSEKIDVLARKAEVYIDCRTGSVREGTITGNTLQATFSPGTIRRTWPDAISRARGGVVGKVWKCSGNCTSLTACHSGSQHGCHIGSMSHEHDSSMPLKPFLATRCTSATAASMSPNGMLANPMWRSG